MEQYYMKRINVINNHCIFDNFLLSWQCCTYKHWHIRTIFVDMYFYRSVWGCFLNYGVSFWVMTPVVVVRNIYSFLAFLVASSIAFNHYCTSCLYFWYLFTNVWIMFFSMSPFYYKHIKFIGIHWQPMSLLIQW